MKCVRCVDCGFLSQGIKHWEAPTRVRELLAMGIFPHKDVHCFKSLWSDLRPREVILNEATKDRPCEEFFRYHRGRSPAAHLTLVEKKQDSLQKWLFWIGGVVAGQLTHIPQAIPILTAWLRKLR